MIISVSAFRQIRVLMNSGARGVSRSLLALHVPSVREGCRLNVFPQQLMSHDVGRMSSQPDLHITDVVPHCRQQHLPANPGPCEASALRL